VCFWFTYSFDKALSLNFGRTSNFSDFYITITYPSFLNTPITVTYIVWVDLGKVQSWIYEKLYSAKGQLESPESRANAARGLAQELRELQRRCRVSYRVQWIWIWFNTRFLEGFCTINRIERASHRHGDDDIGKPDPGLPSTSSATACSPSSIPRRMHFDCKGSTSAAPKTVFAILCKIRLFYSNLYWLARYFLFLYSQPLPSLAHLTINPSALGTLHFVPSPHSSPFWAQPFWTSTMRIWIS
jgi:hypothetical protein